MDIINHMCFAYFNFAYTSKITWDYFRSLTTENKTPVTKKKKKIEIY